MRSTWNRSDANRSSADGHERSSAPRRWARSTRLSMMAPSANSATMEPSAPGPWASSSRPSTERAGRVAPTEAFKPRSSTRARTRQRVWRSNQRRVRALERPATSSSPRGSAANSRSASKRGIVRPTAIVLSLVGAPRIKASRARSSGVSRSSARRLRPGSSHTRKPAHSSSQRGNALSDGRGGSARSTRASGTAHMSEE